MQHSLTTFEKGGRYDRMEEKQKYHFSSTTTTYYHNHSYRAIGGERRGQRGRGLWTEWGGRTSETHSHSHSRSFISPLVIYTKVLLAARRTLKFEKFQYLQYKSNYTKRTCTWKILWVSNWANLDTWILGVASKQLRLLHGRVRDSTTLINSLIEPSDESWSRMLLLPDAATELSIFGWSGMSSRNMSSSNLNFSVSTLSMSLRYFSNELYNRGPNTVIAFSWRDCAGFLFVGYWITRCVLCLGCFLVFILYPMEPSIFGTICCVIFQIYRII